MRVIRLRAPKGLEGLQLATEEVPEPRAGEVLVRIRATSLNAHDDMLLKGMRPTHGERVPMTDGAGEVVAVGEGVDAFEVGDNVVSTFYPYWMGGGMTSEVKAVIPSEDIDGYAREYACAPAHFFTRAPTGLTHVQAATLPCAGVTAWRSLVTCGQVKPGDDVLVLGTGGVSLFALQFAKAAGARVIATSSSEEKLEKLRRLGADAVVNYKTIPDWGHKARELTDGRGVDHVIEVGGPATLMQSIASCRTGGHIALIGVLTGFAGELVIPALFANQIRTSGISIGNRADQLDMIRAIDANRLKPVVDRTFPLEEITAAFRYYETKHHFGKICVSL
jgi:NADPH:quinone reductase-like Zn-dependent oxidoreductase